MSARLTHDFVLGEIGKAGYKLLSTYEGAIAKLDLECDKGHQYKACWHDFSQGARCPQCFGKAKLTHNFVMCEIGKTGYKLLSIYENARAKLDLECDKGHRYKAPWSSFNAGYRCTHCSGTARLTHNFVMCEIGKTGYKLLSIYENARAKLDLECDKGHRYKACWDKFSQGKRCPHCFGSTKLTHDFVLDEIGKTGYKLLSIYEQSGKKLDLECDKGHRYKACWNSFNRGSRCPYCANHGFKPDKPASLYYIRFDHNGKDFYKIGITNKTITERFCGEPTPYTVIMETRYLFGYLAAELERDILANHKRHQYQGDCFLVSGNTELFTKDVLRLDKKQRVSPCPQPTRISLIPRHQSII